MRLTSWSSHGVKRTGWNLDSRAALSALALVIGLSLLAGFYLTLASHTAMLGRRLQHLEAERATIVRENAHLQDQIARSASAMSMRQRAIAAGYVTTGTVVFIPIDVLPVQDDERQEPP